MSIELQSKSTLVIYTTVRAIRFSRFFFFFFSTFAAVAWNSFNCHARESPCWLYFVRVNLSFVTPYYLKYRER